MKKIYYKKRNNENLFEEKTPAIAIIKFLYSNTFAKPILKLLVANSFLSSFYGKLMNLKNSKNKIPKFVKDYDINLEESEKNEFNSFNDFFIRKLKPNARPIDHNPHSITSPADGKILVYENIDNAQLFNIKGNNFNINKLLQNPDHINKFQNCQMAIIRLAPTDYHRFHFIIPCYVLDTHEIRGYYYSVSPIAHLNLHEIFCQNKRTICEAHNDDIGTYLILEIGATMVGSIVQTYTSHTNINKGDEKGYFEFGGSTVILIFQKNSITFDDDIIQNSLNGIETKVQMGEQIGKIKKYT